MRQVLIELPIAGGVKIYGYGLMLVFAFLGALGLAKWRAKRVNLDPLLVEDMAVWVILGGLIGARAFFVIQYWGTRVTSIWSIFKIWEGGIVLYGSIIGGTLAFFAFRRFRPFPLRPMLDAIAPALALGIALGRIGCFLNGCCYGDVCNLPWAVAFPKGSMPWQAQIDERLISPTAAHALPVHPTQLYSTLDGFILVALLSAYYPLRRRDGEVMAMLMVAYPITRFLIERLRNDEKAIAFGMTISQNVSILLLIFGLINWAVLSAWPAARYADTVEPAKA